MEKQLTEEQIEEKVNRWIEKMIRYTQYQIDIGELPKRFEEHIQQRDDTLIDYYKRELRRNPAWVPVRLIQPYGSRKYWVPEEF